MDKYKKLLLGNKAWVEDQLHIDNQFFIQQDKGQNPHYLWIGCSDSRVPADEITGTGPGEIFVHRNIANLVVHNDMNLLSVIEYAVHHLDVRHIIVCGHYKCGGVSAALSNLNYGILNNWLRSIKDTCQKYRDELAMLATPDEVHRRLVELNVMEQVQNLAKTSTVQLMWEREEFPLIHGWVYELETGLLKTLTQIGPHCKLDDIYRFKFP